MTSISIPLQLTPKGLQRDDGLTIVETVAHYRVDDDRIGELRLLGRCRQTGKQNSKYTNETFLSD